MKRTPGTKLFFQGAALAFAASAGAWGCHAGGNTEETASAAASASAASEAASASAAPSAAGSGSAPARHVPPPMQLCRAASVSGAPKIVSLLGTPLEAGAPTTVAESSDIPEDVWIDLDKGAKLTSRHPRSTRETAFVGPGRIRACVGHGEEAWLQGGSFESVLASGERPGGEEWVVTPVGVVRYGATKLEVHVTPGSTTSVAKAEVKVLSGTAYTWTGDQTGPIKPPVAPPTSPMTGGPGGPVAAPLPDGWTRLDAPRTVTLSTKKPGKLDDLAQASLELCKANAKAAKELAMAVASPDASLAQIAPKHVNARHLARAACLVASLRAGTLEPSPARDALYASIKEADAEWKSARPHVPHGRLH